MIVDLQESGDLPREYHADVMIAGAGPAGISLALELARARPDWHILLAEAGGTEEPSNEERELYSLALGEKSYSVADICRRRKLGGTSAHWGGWAKPPDATDFLDNPEWSLPAWPFGQEELAPHLAAACDWCEIASTNFELDSLQGREQLELLSLPEEAGLAEHLFRFSPPTRFGRRYREELETRENLTCLLHANLNDIEMRGDGVQAAQVTPLGGRPVRVLAGHYVLAMGGIESTRQLLNFRAGLPDDGEGIQSPHLGACFADHFGISPGLLLAPAGLTYLRTGLDDGPVMPVLGFAPQQIRGNGENNSAIYLWAEPGDDSLLARYGGQSSLGFRAGEYWHYRVKVIVEPRPVPDSRLTLLDERDALGLRRVKLDWRIDPADVASAYRLVDALGAAVAGSGLGRLRIEQPNSEALRAGVTGGCHHMGTLRMAARSEDGVVDPDLRVYGTRTLYVASSAVLPRYGYSNPTLTTVALSVRLARHLAGPGGVTADG